MDQGDRDEPSAPAPIVPDTRTAVAEIDWSRLIALHQHRVVLSLLAAGFGFDRARELANEAWVRLMEKHRRGALTEVKLPGLAIVQARFIASDERRRESMQARHRDRADSAGLAPLLVDGDRDPEQRLLSRQQARRALDAVATSPPSAQRLFRLLYQDPTMPHARAGETLGLSVQRVRQILCELRKRVRLALEGDRS